MRLLDRYILRQMIAAFALFCLVLAGVIWLTQAVRLIDLVLSSGQSLWRLGEFSLLVLPTVLSMVVPLAGFAAVIYAINKLYGEAELVVMMMAGQSPFALARPVLIFGLAVGLITLAITNFIAPMADKHLTESRHEIRTELANALIREGRFLHPVDGLTIFIRDTNDEGQMRGLFLHDQRDPERPVTYTAERALFLRSGDVARLVMSEGTALSYSAERRLLARVRFDDLTYDISDLISDEAAPVRADELPTWQLLNPGPEVRALARFRAGDFAATGHERIVFGLHALLMPLLALGVMLTGGYQRRGFGKRIAGAVVAGVALVVAGQLAKSAVIGDPAVWPLAYLPDAIAALAVLALLSRATGFRRNRTAAA